MCFYYDGYCDVYEQTPVKSKKERKCHSCGHQIKVGEYYLRVQSLFEGRWDNSQYCGSCNHTREEIAKKEGEEGCGFNESYCPWEEITSVVKDYGLQMSSQEQGQELLLEQREKTCKKSKISKVN